MPRVASGIAGRAIRSRDGRDPVVGVRLPPDLIARIDKHAKKQGVFRSDAIRDLLKAGLRAERAVSTKHAVSPADR